MKKDECVFMSEDDCPKNSMGISCDRCIEIKFYEIVEKAIEDFISLGDSFTAIFEMCNRLMHYKDKPVVLDMPVVEINKVHRVMTALLVVKEPENEEELMYKRLIFHFFGLIIDEFKEREYTEDTYLN